MTYATRFRAYAASQSLTPEQVLERDAQTYPGGKMAGYMCWINEQWRAWLCANKRSIGTTLSFQDHEAFDAYLSQLGETVEGA